VAGALAVGVALAAEELGDLGFENRLYQQAHPQTGDLLHDLSEGRSELEQRFDLCPDALCGR
jgi:hypothetical protein